jgi:hypothetical protein
MADYAGMARRVVDAATKGFRSFHSSPHDIDKFDISKIGTGQGAASYTPGLYFAEHPSVSGQGGEYWQEFSRHPKFSKIERDAADFLALHNFDRQRAAQQTRAQLERNMDFSKSVRSPDELEALARQRADFEQVVGLLESNRPVGPRTYEVNINEDPSRFINWDAPLGQQHPDVVNRVPMLTEAARAEANNRALSATHQRRADELWGMVKDPMQAPASLALDRLRHNMGPQLPGMMRDAGIPGVRYLDQGSRQLQKDTLDAERFARSGPSQHGMDTWAERAAELKATPLTRNTVVYDDSLIDILKRYGVAAGIATPAAAAAFGGGDGR